MFLTFVYSIVMHAHRRLLSLYASISIMTYAARAYPRSARPVAGRPALRPHGLTYLEPIGTSAIGTRITTNVFKSALVKFQIETR